MNPSDWWDAGFYGLAALVLAGLVAFQVRQHRAGRTAGVGPSLAASVALLCFGLGELVALAGGLPRYRGAALLGGATR